VSIKSKIKIKIKEMNNCKENKKKNNNMKSPVVILISVLFFLSVAFYVLESNDYINVFKSIDSQETIE
jgi:hypothetical protein